VSAALLLTGLCIPLTGQAASKTWRITDIAASARVNLREEPSNRSEILAYIPGDARGLRGGDCSGNWCPVEFRGLKGWIYRDYLEPDDEPQQQQQQAQPAPQPQQQEQPQTTAATPSSRLPEDLEQRKSFRLAAKAGGTIPVYVFPSDSMPVAGHLPGNTESVDGLGTCVPNWCYIRSGGLIGWIQAEAISLDDAPADVQATASIAPATRLDERNTLNKTVPTATNVTAPAPAPDIAPAPSLGGAKSYGLAGLAGKSSLPMRAEPEETARILEWIPSDARNVEGLRKCVEQWCLVRYGSTEGWVARRHLADVSLEQTQAFQVSGLPLWSPLKVFDQPASGANVVGEIPSYATGIVPIGNCDKSWCHIRYLGIAGWVSSQNLEPQKR
jgi:SH3-like domain-containing protein